VPKMPKVDLNLHLFNKRGALTRNGISPLKPKVLCFGVFLRVRNRPSGFGSVQILNLPRKIHDHDSEVYLTGVFLPGSGQHQQKIPFASFVCVGLCGSVADFELITSYKKVVPISDPASSV